VVVSFPLLVLIVLMYSIGGAKREMINEQSLSKASPGPAAYNAIDGLSFIKGKQTPKFTIASRNVSLG
jgi:hypothetical protein